MLLSLCMIVKNEENNLPRCLESVKEIVDEMIIVDTGSTDSTIDIAKSFCAKVYNFPWNGSFSDARNHSLKQATGDWIMIMDADDELESSGKEAVLDIIASNEADAYFFETISYIGEKPGADVLKNMNLRILKNGQGYFYSNAIHEQIYCNIKAVNPSAKIVNKNIKVYHYGYLNKNITEHNKRARNISLLEKELAQKPGYPFALFNLGSEYYALGDNLKAIEYFEEAYRKFNPKEGFSSHLILKMVHCYLGLGRYDEALNLCFEGLFHYPEFTDLEYMKGIIKKILNQHLLAIEHFKKCCEMGEAPNHLNVIVGTGTFRAFFMLGEIYYNLEDYKNASINYINSLNGNPEFTIVLPKLIKAYCKLNLGQSHLLRSINDLKKFKCDKFESTVFDILIQEKYYELAYHFIGQYEKINGISSYTIYNKSLCKLYLKKYSTALKMASKIKNDPELGIQATCILVLCNIINENLPAVNKILESTFIDKGNIMLKVLICFKTLIDTGTIYVLSDDESVSQAYTKVIFEILEMLLITKQFDLFEKSLALLNSVSDKTVLLRLAKLYYHENCFGLAYKEFIRSIKAFDYIDIAGSELLHKLKQKGF